MWQFYTNTILYEFENALVINGTSYVWTIEIDVGKKSRLFIVYNLHF